MGNVTLRDGAGRAYDVPEEQLPGYLSQGFTPETPAERVQPAIEAAREDRFGGSASATLASATYGALGTVTGGLSDASIAALGGGGGLRELQDLHPIAHGAGAVAGAFVPVGLPGFAAEAGAAIRAGGEGAGLAGALGRGTLAGGVEGALYGAGQGVSDLSLSDDPLTMEHAASVLSSSALYGAALGGALGGAGSATEYGLQKAKGALDDFVLARNAAKAIADNPETIGSADVTALDAKGLDKAQAVELDRIAAERAPVRQQFAQDLDEFARDMRDQQLSRAAKGAEDRDAREAGKVLFKSDMSLRGLTNDPVGLAERPERALSALRTQENALTKLQSWGEEETTRYIEERAAAPAKIREDILAGKHPSYPVPSAISPRGIDLGVEREMAARYGTDAALPKNLQLLNEVPAALERNRQLQARLADLVADPASARLDQIAAAREQQGLPKQQSLGAMALHAAARFAGPLGAIAEHGAGAVAGLKKAAGAAAERGAKAASALLGPASRAAGQAAGATPLATKVLASVRYGDKHDDQGNPEPEPTKLHELFKRRTDEVKEQVQIAADGSFQMRPQARAKMAAKLSGLGAVDPVTADRLESAGAARIAWLASQIPRRPDIGAVQVGPDTSRTSDMEMRSWARKAAAAEDLPAVFERAVHGQITPEDVMALRALAPEMLNHYITEVSAQLPTLQKTLPYERRLSLSMLTGQPVDPALDPRVFRVFQGQFTDEVGTAGGTQAPKAMPQFGSIRKSPDAPTPAQNRAQGAHA